MIAVTKGFGPEAGRAALAAGLGDLGENYAAELLAKAEALAGEGRASARRWHFLGTIQRNKVASLAPVVGCGRAWPVRPRGNGLPAAPGAVGPGPGGHHRVPGATAARRRRWRPWWPAWAAGAGVAAS